MMNFEDGFCSLDLAIEMKELGVSQDALFAWYDCQGNKRIIYKKEVRSIVATFEPGQREYLHIADAFSVAELGDTLKAAMPGIIVSQLPYYDRQIKKWNLGMAEDFIANTEADARAKMRIYLIKNKPIEVK